MQLTLQIRKSRLKDGRATDEGMIPRRLEGKSPRKAFELCHPCPLLSWADLGIAFVLGLRSASPLPLFPHPGEIAGRLLEGGVDCRLRPKRGVVNLNNPLPFVGIVAVALSLLSHQWLSANGNKKLEPALGGRERWELSADSPTPPSLLALGCSALLSSSAAGHVIIIHVHNVSQAVTPGTTPAAFSADCKNTETD